MSISVIIAGDYSPNDQVATKIDNGEYGIVLDEVRRRIENADYSIVNFETTVRVKGSSPIKKCGPHLSCSSNAISALHYSGFQCVTLANNHFGDYGDISVAESLKLLKEIGIDYVGGGNNLYDALKVLYKDVKGKRLAILNYCEEEFTIATDNHGGSAPLDMTYVIPSIMEARTQADYVIVITHSGKEFYQLPTPRMKRVCRALIDLGADAVLNHHQHCYGGYEVYNEKPIFYGLGNFCFDFRNKKNESWNEGYMVELSLDEKIGFEIIPYYQSNGRPTISLMDDDEKRVVQSKIADLNAIIKNQKMLESKYDSFSKTFFRSIRMSLTPYSNRYLYSLCLRHLIPGFISKERKLILTDYVNCDSWRDIFLQYLKSDER